MKRDIGALGDYHLKKFLSSKESLTKIKRLNKTRKDPDYNIHASKIIFPSTNINSKTINTIYPSVINEMVEKSTDKIEKDHISTTKLDNEKSINNEISKNHISASFSHRSYNSTNNQFDKKGFNPSALVNNTNHMYKAYGDFIGTRKPRVESIEGEASYKNRLRKQTKDKKNKEGTYQIQDVDQIVNLDDFNSVFKFIKHKESASKDDTKIKRLNKIICAQKSRIDKRQTQGKPTDLRDYDAMLKDLNINYYKAFGKPESQIPWISEAQANKVQASENAIPQGPSTHQSKRINEESQQLKKWQDQTSHLLTYECSKKRSLRKSKDSNKSFTNTKVDISKEICYDPICRSRSTNIINGPQKNNFKIDSGINRNNKPYFTKDYFQLKSKDDPKSTNIDINKYDKFKNIVKPMQLRQKETDLDVNSNKKPQIFSVNKLKKGIRPNTSNIERQNLNSTYAHNVNQLENIITLDEHVSLMDNYDLYQNIDKNISNFENNSNVVILPQNEYPNMLEFIQKCDISRDITKDTNKNLARINSDQNTLDKKYHAARLLDISKYCKDDTLVYGKNTMSNQELDQTDISYQKTRGDLKKQQRDYMVSTNGMKQLYSGGSTTLMQDPTSNSQPTIEPEDDSNDIKQYNPPKKRYDHANSILNVTRKIQNKLNSFNPKAYPKQNENCYMNYLHEKQLQNKKLDENKKKAEYKISHLPLDIIHTTHPKYKYFELSYTDNTSHNELQANLEHQKDHSIKNLNRIKSQNETLFPSKKIRLKHQNVNYNINSNYKKFIE